MASNVNSYATLTELKNILGVTSTTDDIPMRKILEASSRAIESYCNRFFYTRSETRYYNGSSSPLWIDDLLSINTSGLKLDEDGNTTFESTLATTDYLLYPLNEYPKIRIELSHDSNYGSFASGIKQGVQIAGVWGYGDGTTATPYVQSTTTNEAFAASDTTLTVTSGTNLSAGMTLLLVDADTGKTNEQLYVTGVSTNDLTVERGVNGSTDQSHATAKQLYFYRYPRDITQACIDLAVALYQNRAKQGLQTERLGDYSYTVMGTSLGKSMVESILDNIKGYKRMRF